MRYARPEANPPEPATNSATTAPTSAKPPEMRNPARKYGNAAGKRSSRNVAIRLAPYNRNRSTRSAGADASPAEVLANTGKNATMVAHTTSAANGLLTQTMISGAIATIGVTCNTTAHGWIAAASSRLDAIDTASTTPSSAATNRAANVTSSVDPSDDNSPAGSAMKALMISQGPGTRY